MSVTLQPDPRWEAFAAREPYFAVLTAPRFLTANLTPASEREFFDSGEAQVDWTLRTIELRLVPEFTPMTTLEYGCGIGRLAIPFARRPGSVTAVDRSPAMLERARREAERQGVTHVKYLSPAELFTTQPAFDLVNCYLVLQRLPQAEGLALLDALIGCLGGGGIGVFHVPYRATTSRLVETSRRLRRVPAINGVVNLLRGKPVHEPFVASYTYDLHDVLRVLDDRAIASTHVAFEHHEGLHFATIFVEAPPRPASRAAEPGAPLQDAARTIDVRRLVEQTSIDDLNRTAEEYFASLTGWEHHLAKPFSKADETPPLLTDVATVLQGLRLASGARVLEFGAGTGWLSRALTQLGCRVILLDVSPTALQIARELYERLPIIGDRPSPQFLLFDGRRIDLADASVERIISFHAFHHVPNPDEILREFGRILAPGGIAAFAEPGPRHSRRPLSQFEMRTYGVVENDVDIHAIWRTARTCGFTDMKLMVFHAPPFHVSLEEYEDLLAGGPTCARWVTLTRGFLRHVRSFLLFKEGTERSDSRSAAGLTCEVRASPASARVLEGEPLIVDATVTNTGQVPWLASDVEAGGVMVGAHLYDAPGTLRTFDVARAPLTCPPRDVAPGETVRCRITLPAQPAGKYLIEVDCVAARVTWFAQLGSRPATMPVTVEPIGRVSRNADR